MADNPRQSKDDWLFCVQYLTWKIVIYYSIYSIVSIFSSEFPPTGWLITWTHLKATEHKFNGRCETEHQNQVMIKHYAFPSTLKVFFFSDMKRRTLRAASSQRAKMEQHQLKMSRGSSYYLRAAFKGAIQAHCLSCFMTGQLHNQKSTAPLPVIKRWGHGNTDDYIWKDGTGCGSTKGAFVLNWISNFIRLTF